MKNYKVPNIFFIEYIKDLRGVKVHFVKGGYEYIPNKSLTEIAKVYKAHKNLIQVSQKCIYNFDYLTKHSRTKLSFTDQQGTNREVKIPREKDSPNYRNNIKEGLKDKGLPSLK